jgi:hypothetical protein
MAICKISRCPLWASLCHDHTFVIWQICYVCVLYRGVYVCTCVCVLLLSLSSHCLCLFPWLQQSTLIPEEVVMMHCRAAGSLWWVSRLLHSHLTRVQGQGTTTLSYLGCACEIGSNLQSESHQLRKQWSQWERKISTTGYLAWWKESCPLFGYIFHFPAGHCDTEWGWACLLLTVLTWMVST